MLLLAAVYHEAFQAVLRSAHGYRCCGAVLLVESEVRIWPTTSMEMERRFYLLDVFAEGPYSGNQLAVFRNASALGESDMLRLAREVHISETAFILSDSPHGGGYDVRIFTPAHEIPFSGHAVLGAAWVLQCELLHEPVSRIMVNLGIGPVQVDFDYHYGDLDAVWMAHRPPEYGPVVDPQAVASAVGLDPSELDTRWPVQEVSAGLPFIMVPVPSLDVIQRARVDANGYGNLSSVTGVKALYLFTHEAYNPENDFNVRMFAPEHGIAEDPATGAAAGCLAAYLLRYVRPDAHGLDLRIEQGYEVRRPSLLFARSRREKDRTTVTVGGRIVMVAQGNFV